MLEDVGALFFKLPPRSPDLNLIKNIFALVTKTLRKQVIENNVIRETRNEMRVRETILSLTIAKIVRIIKSTDKRITLIMESKGCRIRY